MEHMDKTSGKTFSLATPADLYRKIRHESYVLYNSPPDNLEERAYALMNGLTSAWQMKDWVYEALKTKGELARLDELARRKIRDLKEFGAFLCGNSPWMDMCFQLATAAKHLSVKSGSGRDTRTRVAEELIPGDDKTRAELMVDTADNSISAPALLLMVVAIWGGVLVQLGLIQREDTH
jgi:hypothetical protein